MARKHLGFAFTLALTLAGPALAAPPAGASVERDAGGALVVRWISTDPVDVLAADTPDQPARVSRVVSPRDADGTETVAATGLGRSYFLLCNARTGETTRVAERLIPLERGSNFRDLGGYPAAGGRHVRWGMIYRSGATPMLSDTDLARIKQLGLVNMVDLRSHEERVLAPSRIDGVPYAAVGYTMAKLDFSGGMEAGYRGLPAGLAPQIRLIFADLLRGEGPLAFNCSAGQDRTGFTAAIILTALGTPRDTVLADYHLSTAYRRPEFEMPRIDPARAADNPATAMFYYYQNLPDKESKPLKSADGTAYLTAALQEIETKWGSVDAYLAKEAGVGPKELKRLRTMYTQ